MSISAAVRKSHPAGVTVIALWTLAGSAAMLAFAAIALATSGYPISGTQTLFALVMLGLLVAGPFGYLFPLLSLGLAALGIMTGIGTLFGRWWARWLNALLSGIVMYQGAMLFSGLASYPQIAASWTIQDWAVPVLFLAANGARIGYVLFSSQARSYLS